jgi:hypothetical protein
MIVGGALASLAVAAALLVPARGALSVVGPRRPPPSSSPPLVLASRSSSSGGEGGGSFGGTPDEKTNKDKKNYFYNDFDDADAAAPPAPPTRPTTRGGASPSPPSPSPPSSSGGDADFLASLRRRRSLLRDSSRELLGRWESGAAASRAAFTINESFYDDARRGGGGGGGGGGFGNEDGGRTAPFDWVRRLAIGSYPRVVCGGASGGVYVADVEAGRLLASAPRAHSPASGGDDLLEEDAGLLRRLYGDYDGGGVLAVAMTSLVVGGGTNADLVASAGREGGIKLHRWVRSGKTTTTRGGGTIDELEFVCSIPMGDGDYGDRTVVTCLRFDSLGRRLFAGGGDGRLRAVTFGRDIFDVEKGMRTMLIPSRTSSSSMTSSPFLWRLKQGKMPPPSSLSPILSLDVAEALGMVATAHVNGDVQIYSHDSDDDNDGNFGSDAFPLLGVWNPFTDTNEACHARSVAFVSGEGGRGDDDDEDGDPSWSIVVGGGNGQMWVQEIHNKRVDTNTGAQRTLDAMNSDDKDGRRITTATTASTMSSSLFRENSMQQIKPSHRGPVVALSSRSGGILVSAGHDGMLRVSRICKPAPKALYGLGGYKVWIGSICIDSEGKRLLSDGRDDVVVVHDFSLEDEG